MFPVDNRSEKSERVNDLGWACVLILESLIPMVIDLILRNLRTSSGSNFVVVMSAKLIWKLICVLFDIVSQIHFKSLLCAALLACSLAYVVSLFALFVSLESVGFCSSVGVGFFGLGITIPPRVCWS
ncbi:FRIGIDA-like protein 4b [Camellia lanceoleosa]|nr:FRIGIDA-like protein 4b [Camellia lanceoleosa]